MSRIADKFKTLRSRWRKPKLEQAPTLSDIQRSLDNLPRTYKKAHKIAVRRQYRSRMFRGIVDSRTRQILSESRGVLDAVEAELRLRKEECEVVEGFDG